jgi:hypothetical protein
LPGAKIAIKAKTEKIRAAMAILQDFISDTYTIITSPSTPGQGNRGTQGTNTPST